MKQFIILLIAILPGLALSEDPPPNFIVILTDDQGWGTTSVAYDPQVPDSKSDFNRTPHIERLAAAGMRFTQGYSAHPNCSPSRAALLTGRSPAALHFTDICNRNSGGLYEGNRLLPPQHINALPEEEQTIPELLKATHPEYTTAHFGKWHLNGGGPEAHGFDAGDGSTGNAEGGKKDNLPKDPKRCFSITERAIDWMKEQSAVEKPFYLQVSHYATHLPLQAQPETLARFESATPGTRHDNVPFAAMIADMDESIGQLLDALAASGVADNTYVIFTSDNGTFPVESPGNINGPLRGSKATIWEAGVRVPFIVTGPGIESNSVSRQPAIGYDILPTICELAGIETWPEAVEGGSLIPALYQKGDISRSRDALHFHWPHYQHGKKSTPDSTIITGDDKLHYWWETGDIQLYNLKSDLAETKNLATTQPEKAAALKKQLFDYLKEIDAQLPTENKTYDPATDPVLMKEQNKSQGPAKPKGQPSAKGGKEGKVSTHQIRSLDGSKREGGAGEDELAALIQSAPADEWKPVEGSMLTEWGEQLDSKSAWSEYPRPQLKREKWVNLNGMWEYSITRQDDKRAGVWDGEILVPFPIEAPLSGVGRSLEPYEALWYRRNFNLQQKPEGRLLLHFEAVDYQSTVWVNGKEVGGHVGGNLPFSFDITDQVKAGRNTLVLKVVDRTNMDDSFQLRGKQRLVNRGIFYTRVSGIWQSVWLEPVPDNHIESLKIDTKLDGEIRIEPSLVGKGNIRTEAWLDGQKVAEGSTVVKVDQPRLWSPDSPTLYQLKVFMQDESGQELDRVESYAGIREVGKIKDKDGNWRFTLNGKTIFHWGPLDQGWWPDGLLTPPSEDAMLFEIDFLKQAGFNMIRKHIKVEPRLYYYHCDRLGMLVWQDQVSGGPNPNWYRLDPSRNKNHSTPEPGDPIDAEWPDAAHEQWMAELKGMIDHLYNYPSIVSWVPFNEAWGQHRTLEVGEWITKYDPSRSINIASGGNFAPVGDIADMHSYPHPEFPFHMNEYDDYIKVVGEFGGHGWKVDGHEWDPKKKNFIYGGMPETIDEYAERYAESIRLLGELKTQGVAGGVYTQTTDVEGEINGLMSYDRKVIKISAEELNAIQSENGLLSHLSSTGQIPTNTPTTVSMNPIYQEVHAAPEIAGGSLQIVVEATQKDAVADGVLLAHGGNVAGYSLHVEEGIPVFEVSRKKEIFRIAWPQPVKGKMRIVAELGDKEMSLSVNGAPQVSAASPGLFRAQPRIGLSVGYDARSNAGSYEVPNPYNGTILSTRIDAGGTPPAVAKVMPRSEIEAGLASHDQALFIKEGWIRDPYIILGPDDYYYLTGTTPNPGDSREQSDPYNTGLGDESIVGWQARIWRSKDLIDWESLGAPFTLKEGIWFEKRPKRFEEVPEKLWFLWAPEVHWLGDRWALTHTSPSPVRGANLALTEGADLKGPWTHPMGVDIGHRHDPSLFKDGDTWYLLYGNTQVVPLNADLSSTTAEPVQIDPSGSRTTPAGETLSVIGHEGATMRKIGDKYVHIGTAWSTDMGRKGSYNLYYCTADKITGPYGPRKFAGRFLGHGTPFQDKQGRWWCTAFYNGNIPPVERKGIETRDLSATAQTINQRGVTIVPLDVKVLEDGDIYIRSKDPAYANPGPDEVQQFSK